jgi:hypothetical protein
MLRQGVVASPGSVKRQRPAVKRSNSVREAVSRGDWPENRDPAAVLLVSWKLHPVRPEKRENLFGGETSFVLCCTLALTYAML